MYWRVHSLRKVLLAITVGAILVMVYIACQYQHKLDQLEAMPELVQSVPHRPNDDQQQEQPSATVNGTTALASTASAEDALTSHREGAQTAPPSESIRTLDAHPEMTGDLPCGVLKVEPFPIICVHPLTKDIHISVDIIKTGVYEKPILRLFLKYLIGAPSAGVIDLGANIGQYSLVAAGMGRKAVAVEPLKANAELLVRAVQLNHFHDRVIILMNAVSNRRGIVPLITSENDQGGIRIQYNVSLSSVADDQIGRTATETILMDDIAYSCVFNTAILKIDVESSEGLAFQHAEKLFNDIHIPYIIMEWSLCCVGQSDPKKNAYAADMVAFLVKRGYTAYGMDDESLPPLDLLKWWTWPGNVLWKRGTLPEHQTTPPPTQGCCRKLDPKSLVDDIFECVVLGVKPLPVICLHPLALDIYTSGDILRSGAHQRPMLEVFREILISLPVDTGFLDIGANIGQYSLVAAGMGHRVVAMEPYTPSARRLLKAVQLNHYQERVTLLQNAISNRRGFVYIVTSGTDQGATKIQDDIAVQTVNELHIGTTVVESVFLDDLRPFCPFASAVMKLNIEGAEALAFQQASQLFDNININHVIMEWDLCCTRQSDPRKLSLAADMVQFLTSRSYGAYDIEIATLPQLDASNWRSWPKYVLWRKQGTRTIQPSQQVAAPPRVLIPAKTSGPRVLNNADKVDASFQCVALGVDPFPQICIHPPELDIYVSGDILRNGAFEKPMMELFRKFLLDLPGAGFIDVGANIGQYSLLAAALGRTVVGVEPFTTSARRLLRAVQLNNFQDKVTIIQNAISNTRGYVDLVSNSFNQGGTKILPDSKRRDPSPSDIGSTVIESVLLDDILPWCTFERAIMKIDIEGSEALAFQHAQKLFDRVHITHVIMEWNLCCTATNDAQRTAFASEMVAFLSGRGYEAYDIESVTLPHLDTAFWQNWPRNILWKMERRSRVQSLHTETPRNISDTGQMNS